MSVTGPLCGVSRHMLTFQLQTHTSNSQLTELSIIVISFSFKLKIIYYIVCACVWGSRGVSVVLRGHSDLGLYSGRQASLASAFAPDQSHWFLDVI